MILEPAPDIVVVAEARDGAEAPAAVLTDVRMPRTDGLTATARIALDQDAPKVIMLTTFDLDECVHAALRAGAVGFLLKDTPPRDLAAAVRTVAAGHAMLAPSVTRRLISAFAVKGPSGVDQARQRLEVLTERRWFWRAVARSPGDAARSSGFESDGRVLVGADG